MLLLLARAGGQGTPALAAAPKGQDGHVDLVGWRDPGSRIPSGDRRPRLYLFTAAWCVPCLLLKRDVFRDPAAAALIRKQFVPIIVIDRVRQDGKNGPAAAALKAGFGVRSFPTLVIETPGSEPRTLVDYVAKDRVLQFLSGGRSPDVPIIK
jgi:thioredoxin-related protein